MIIIILTVDYEIFGDGSGDVQKCLIEPTDSLLKVCDRYDVPITFFFEVCEYWAFKKEEDAGNLPQNYRPARCIEDQVRRVIKAGHDLQLHIHPQWLEYRYLPDKGWIVNFDFWRLSQLPTDVLYNTFKRGKDTLERLIRPYRNDYKCFVFRAGAWCIQPEKDILNIMQEIGFLIDSTVVPGITRDDGLTVFDFREAPLDLPAWRVKDDVCVPREDGRIWEVPIFTYKYGLIERVSRRVMKRSSTKSPPGCRGSYVRGEVTRRKDWLYYLNRFKSYTMMDFCAMTARDMMKGVEIARKRFSGRKGFPLVMIGHSKAFANGSELSIFFESCLSNFKDEVIFGTYSDWLNTTSGNKDSVFCQTQGER